MFSGAPAYAILLTTKFEENITTGDIGFFALEVLLVASEFISDGQMWGKSLAVLPTRIYKDLLPFSALPGAMANRTK